MNIKTPSCMKLHGNLAKNCSKYKQRFVLYLEASVKINKHNKLKVVLLLNCMGNECIYVFNSFKLPREDASYFIL